MQYFYAFQLKTVIKASGYMPSGPGIRQNIFGEGSRTAYSQTNAQDPQNKWKVKQVAGRAYNNYKYKLKLEWGETFFPSSVLRPFKESSE